MMHGQPSIKTTGAVDWLAISLQFTVGLLYMCNCPLSTLNTSPLPEPLTTVCLVIPNNLTCTFSFSYLIQNKQLVIAFLTTSFCCKMSHHQAARQEQ